ncbi:MAG: hypothetical protein MR958_09505 [Spirochaetia bacterium]|nr:hypothetical protein [Spirochaetia bacterium]
MKKILTILLISLPLVSFLSCGTTKEAGKMAGSITYKQDDKPGKKNEVINEEYLRSTKALTEESVTVEEFENDKAEILKIINELKVIMDNGDKTKWLTYIDPDSINYYSNHTNLRKVREKLPNKQIQLHGIGDYFKYVFIPSRKNSNIDEIRYISKSNIRAVQIREDKSELVYYNFVKKDNKWYVHIPTLSEQ